MTGSASIPSHRNQVGDEATTLGVALIDPSTGDPFASGALAVGTPGDVIPVTLSLDTSAYADGDVHADFQEVTGFFSRAGGRALIQSVSVVDKDDQGIAFDILTTPLAVSLGTENSAPNISDTNAETVQRLTRVETSDYIDLGGVRVATKTGLGLMVEADVASTSLRIGTIIRGIGTYTASGVILRFGVIHF